MWNKTKSLYDTDAAYWYSQYEEQFLFEKRKAGSRFYAGRHINHEILALQKRLQEFEAYEKKLDTWKMQL